MAAPASQEFDLSELTAARRKQLPFVRQMAFAMMGLAVIVAIAATWEWFRGAFSDQKFELIVPIMLVWAVLGYFGARAAAPDVVSASIRPDGVDFVLVNRQVVAFRWADPRLHARIREWVTATGGTPARHVHFAVLPPFARFLPLTPEAHDALLRSAAAARVQIEVLDGTNPPSGGYIDRILSPGGPAT